MQSSATEMIPWMEHLSYKVRLRARAVHGEEKALEKPESSPSVSRGGL